MPGMTTTRRARAPGGAALVDAVAFTLIERAAQRRRTMPP
jgi:hypothetical protein